MSGGSTGRARWILLRTTALGPEEEGVLPALAQEAARMGVELVTVLAGSAAYDAERSPDSGGSGAGPVWLLEEDHYGRGIRTPPGGGPRRVTPDQLLEAIMSAEKVISFS